MRTTALSAAILAAAVIGGAAAQDRDDRYVTGTISASAVAPGAPEWSGESGASGHPLMTAAAIRAAAANFHHALSGCGRRRASAACRARPIEAFTASLTPDLRIMDLLDNQPEFTKSFWDYLDILVTDARIAKGRELLEKYRATFDAVERRPTASTAISSPRSGASRPITAPSAAIVR